MKIFARLSVGLAFATTLALTQSACLKTRAQLKDEPSSNETQEQGDSGASAPSKPVPAHIESVQPQGNQYAIDEIKSEITRLNGKIDDMEQAQKNAAASGNAADKDVLKKLETRMEEMEHAQAAMIEQIKKLQESPAASAGDPDDIYQKGKKDYTAGQLGPAIEAFTLYLERQPNGRFAEEATFKRGESHYILKEYKKAIVDYSKFPEKFHKSKRLPMALFKIGQSFEALGMKDDAKGFYQELVEKYPKSAEAKKVPRKLLK